MLPPPSRPSKASRAAAIVGTAAVTLLALSFGARDYLRSIVADAPIYDVANTATMPDARFGAFDATPIGTLRAVGTVDEAKVVGPETLHLVGWILTPTLRVPKRVVAIVDGVRRIELTRDYGFARPDVAAALHVPRAVRSGIIATVSLVGLTIGEHRVTFAVVSDDGKTLYALGGFREFESH